MGAMQRETKQTRRWAMDKYPHQLLDATRTFALEKISHNLPRIFQVKSNDGVAQTNESKANEQL